MVIESRDGTKWVSSMDGIIWERQGLLHPKDDGSPYDNPYDGHSAQDAEFATQLVEVLEAQGISCWIAG